MLRLLCAGTKNPARKVVAASGALSVALSALAMSSCGHPVRGPKHMSVISYGATQKAVEALEAANRARNAPDALYDPKFQSAEQAVDQVTGSIGDESSDAWAANQVRRCLSEMRDYRESFKARDKDNAAIAHLLKGLTVGRQMKDANGVLSRNAATLDACLVSARSYL